MAFNQTLYQTTHRALGLSNHEVARRIGIGYQSLCEWRRGASHPKPENEAKLHQVLGLELGQLFKEQQGATMIGICQTCGSKTCVSSRRGSRLADHRCHCGGNLQPLIRAQLEMFFKLKKEVAMRRRDGDYT